MLDRKEQHATQSFELDEYWVKKFRSFNILCYSLIANRSQEELASPLASPVVFQGVFESNRSKSPPPWFVCVSD